MKTNPTVLAIRERVNLTHWLVTIRRAMRAEPDGPRKDFLRAMYANVAKRLP
jgi:hypothetical protein